MATRKAIVLDDSGRFQELQAGDTLAGPVAEVDVVSLTNNSGGAITRGMAVYLDGADSVDTAQANAAATSPVVGLVADASIADGVAGSIQTDGILSSSDWTAVIGAVSLTPQSEYFLSDATAARLTTTPPAAAPNSLVYVGRALSATDLELSIERPVLRG